MSTRAENGQVADDNVVATHEQENAGRGVAMPVADIGAAQPARSQSPTRHFRQKMAQAAPHNEISDVNMVFCLIYNTIRCCLIHFQLLDFPSRNASHKGVVGHIFCYHGSDGDDGIPTYRHTRTNGGPDAWLRSISSSTSRKRGSSLRAVPVASIRSNILNSPLIISICKDTLLY